LDCKYKHKKNLPHPEAWVRGRCRQLQLDGITDLAFEEVAAQSKVAFQMPDSWLNRCPSPKSRFGLSFLVSGGVLFRPPGCHDLGCATVRFASESFVGDGHGRPVSARPDSAAGLHQPLNRVGRFQASFSRTEKSTGT